MGVASTVSHDPISIAISNDTSYTTLSRVPKIGAISIKLVRVIVRREPSNLEVGPRDASLGIS